MKKLLFLLLFSSVLFAQNPIRNADGALLGASTNNLAGSSVLEARSTTKGFLPPRMTTTQRNAISSPATGLMIYNTTTNTYNGYNGTSWVEIGGTSSSLADVLTIGGRNILNMDYSPGDYDLITSNKSDYIVVGNPFNGNINITDGIFSSGDEVIINLQNDYPTGIKVLSGESSYFSFNENTYDESSAPLFFNPFTVLSLTYLGSDRYLLTEYAGSGGTSSQDLQQTLDNGNEANVPIILTDGTTENTLNKNGSSTTSNGATINTTVQTDGSTTSFYGETSNGNSVFVNAFDSEGPVIGGTNINAGYTIKATNLTGSNQVNLEIPNKATGNYTIATTADGVQSVTGGLVDNTNPQNPIILDTDLSYHASPTDGTVNINSGTPATITLVDNTNAGLSSPAEHIKLAGIASGATAYTNEDAQDAVGLILTDTSTVDFTYNDAANTISAIVPDDAVTNAKLNNMSTQTIKGRTTSGTGDPEDLSKSQVQEILGLPTSSTDNVVPRFDGTGGNLQTSGISIDDNGAFIMTGIAGSTYTAKKLEYDTTLNQWIAYDNDSATSLNLGYETWFTCTNNTGSPIPNGSVVYISGASSGIPTIALAKADAGSTSVGIGITTETIANGATGKVTQSGLVNGMNTSGLTAGAVYVSETTAGVLTNTAPSAPNYRMRVGFVGVINATTGTILVTPSTAALGNGTANQVFGMNSAGTAQEVKTIQGTASQVTITHTTNTITASLPATINVNTSGNSATVTTNANLTGPITSVGNATSISSQTGTGTKFVVDTNPVFASGFTFATSSTKASAAVDGTLLLTDNAGGTFSRLMLGGTSSSFPAIKKIGNGLGITNGNDSAMQNLTVAGMRLAYTAKTTTYTITDTDYYINCTSGTFTVTLPTAVTVGSGGGSGKAYLINNSGTGTITIATTSSQTIDGSSTKTLSTQNSNIKVFSDGANWVVESIK